MTIQAKVISAFDKLEAKYPEAVQTGQVRRITTTGGGPSDTTGGTTTTTDYDTRMCIFNVAGDRIDGTNILAGDWQVVVEPPAIEVASDDLIVCSEGVLTIEQLGRVASGGTTFVYDMVCRG